MSAHAGVSKPVKLFRFDGLTCGAAGVAGVTHNHTHYPIAELIVRTKLCCACFNPYLQNRLAVSDAEGGVLILDTAAQHDVMQFEEHSSRVWAVDYSPHDPALLLSASMDRTVRLWRSTQEASIGIIAESHQVRSDWASGSTHAWSSSCQSHNAWVVPQLASPQGSPPRGCRCAARRSARTMRICWRSERPRRSHGCTM
jgi:WD40 repeat protein